MGASIFHSGLSKDFSLILNDDSYDDDVIIQVGENQNIKEFHAHSVILSARSPYFKSIILTDRITKKDYSITKKDDMMIVFSKPNITPTVFNMILKYIYAGELDLTKQSGEDILGLLVASDELIIEELFKYTQDYLIEKQASWVQNNSFLVLHTVFNLPSCKKLQDYCLDSICKDPQPFITSETFLSLDKDILLCLLKRDDLQLEEIVAWDSLIKWGIEQTPGLGSKNSDKSKWNNENFEALKKSLNSFIPLIRFVGISSADFYEKVRPYKSVIPSHIYEEIIEFHYKNILPKTITLPPRVRDSAASLTSTIVKPKFANIISNWIDKNDSTALSNNNENYEFNLIYSMNRDGLNCITFYNKCNKQGPFIVLIRAQSKKIYGGYNPIGYAKKQGWCSSAESFIFSFENDQNIHNMKISRVTNTYYAVYDYPNYSGFFSFGNYLYIGGQNLCIGYSGTQNYDDIFNQQTEFIEEMEVFSVVNYKRNL